jgi:transcription elongation factor Elf1
LVKEGDIKPAGNKFIFRCFLCGDSKKSDDKARGALIYDEEGAVLCCMNCGARRPFIKYLIEEHVDLFKDLIREVSSGEGRRRSRYKPKPQSVVKKDGFKSVYEVVDNKTRDLCVSLIEKRKLPFMFAAGLKYTDEGEYAGRLIIPYYKKDGSYSYLSARDLYDRSVEKYITPYNIKRPIYNDDFINFSKPVFAIEGEVDSSFVHNSAGFGSNTNIEDILCKHKDNRFNPSNTIIFSDNDKAGISTAIKCMRHGFRVVRWSTRGCKDINDGVMSGIFKIDEEGMVDTSQIMDLVMEPSAFNIYALGKLLEAMRAAD